MDGINIIIPCAGFGNRFKEDGYDKPKPLINVLGEPLIYHVLKNLKAREGDRIYIPYNQELDKYYFQQIITKKIPQLEIYFIPLNFRTRGAAETVLCCLNKMNHLDKKTLVVDADTFYVDDILQTCREESESAIFYFKDESDQEIYSYIKLDAMGVVKDIREKRKISINACTGAYLFKTGDILKNYCETVLNAELKQKGEYYLSSVYELMIPNFKIASYKVDKFCCLGTPHQLKAFCINNDDAAYPQDNPKRFCFDLDGTLCTYPKMYNDYSTVEPIIGSIKKLKYLHSLGHTIIISTARKMKSSGGNVGEATEMAHKEVFEFLQKYEIPYSEIHFGKPHADFYIDDLAVKPFSDVDKEIGFYDSKVEPRHFNEIKYNGGFVIKTTNNPGEIYWYKHIPTEIKKHFATPFSIQDNKITMSRIDGIPLNYLFVNNSLTHQNIDLLFHTIKKVNQSQPCASDNMFLYENYVQKLHKRYSEFNYKLISEHAGEVYWKIHHKLFEYEKHKQGRVGVIHGDMVFSNIFLCEHRMLKFIDMRGKVGELETIFGDIFYDYAKVYQSLYGYDFILNDVEVNKPYATSLRTHFEMLFSEAFGKEKLEHLKNITASLFFSLIPLHTDINKQKKYFALAQALV